MLHRGGILALFVLTLSLAACSDDEVIDDGSGGTTASGGSTSGGGTTSSGGTTASGGSSGIAGAAGSAGTAGAGGSAGAAGSAGAGGAAGAGGSAGATVGCNYLVQIGTQVTAQITAAAAPTPQGGAITDGFYKLTAVKLYGGATGTTFWRSLRFVGNEMKTVERDGTATVDVTHTGTYVVASSQLTRTDNCPGTDVFVMGFTAGTNSFVAYEDQGSGQLVELTYEWTSS